MDDKGVALPTRWPASRGMMNLRFAAALLAVLAAASIVQAHGADPPRPQETRLLHDHNDDCGGDGVTSRCGGTFDLIALDIQEFNDGSDKVNFRFTLDKGQQGSHKLVFSYDSPSGRKTFETVSTDQATFSGGFDSLTTTDVGDGTRFWLDATVSAEKTGLQAGSKIRNFKVEAQRDDALGDFMPGGYEGDDGPVQNPDQGDGPTNYLKPDYTGRGSTSSTSATSNPSLDSTDEQDDRGAPSPAFGFLAMALAIALILRRRA